MSRLRVVCGMGGHDPVTEVRPDDYVTEASDIGCPNRWPTSIEFVHFGCTARTLVRTRDCRDREGELVSVVYSDGAVTLTVVND